MKKFLPIVAVVVLLMLFMAPTASAAPPAWGGDCGGANHCVKYGETLYSIGRMYNKDPYYIARYNGLQNPNYIYAGQILYIPPDGPPYPWYGHQGCGGYDCDYRGGYGGGYHGDCGGNDCNYQGGYGGDYRHDSCYNCGYPKPTPYYGGGYGYDYTGYYYDGYYPQYKRYSHTCGYDDRCY